MPDWLEQAWLQRYLDRGLEPAETVWFEAYLIGRPHLVAALEDDLALRDAIAREAELLTTGLGSGHANTPALPRARGRRWQRPPLWLAAAASGVLGIGLGWVVMQGTHERGEALAAAPPRVVYDTLRGALSAPREEPGDATSPIRLYEVPLPAGAHIIAAYVELADRRVDLPAAPASADGYATFALPVDWRGAGVLRVELGFDAPGETARTLDFAL